MDIKTVLVSVVASVAAAAVTVPAVNYVTLQAASPGTPDSGHINVSGNVIAGRVGVNDTPGLARVQVKETGGLQALRAISGTGVAVYGQSNATTGLGAGGYFTSASAGGRAVVGEQMSATGNTVGGLFYTHSPNGIGLWGRHIQSTGTSPGVLGETLSTGPDAVGLLGQVTSTSPGSYATAVRGMNNSTTGSGIGVYGSQNGSGWGVYGTSQSGIGVLGETTTGPAGFFQNNNSGHVTYLATPNNAIEAYGDIKKYYNGFWQSCVPVAYGFVNSDGSIASGSSNFSSAWDAGNTRYNIHISGETFFYSDYTTIVSGVGDTKIYGAASGGGDMRVYAIDTSGVNHQSSFGFNFVVYKTQPSAGPPLPLPKHNYKDDREWAKNDPKAFKAYMKLRHSIDEASRVTHRPDLVKQ